MRNLVSLQRRVWALETFSATTDRCVAFSSIPGDSHLFFLRASGRIESLQLEEDDAQLSCKDLELFLELREFVDDAAASTGCWKWMSYVAELGALICASTNGSLVSVDVDTMDGEEVGNVDSGLRSMAWSGNQEMVALVTGAGSLVIMNNDWEVLHETAIAVSLPSELKLEECGQDAVHWSCGLCWREDSKFIALNVATQDIKSAKVMQKVVVFTEQLEFHALGRLEDGRAIAELGTALHWSESLALLASSEERKGRLVVVFFERNGLRHGEFAIPATYCAPKYCVGKVRFNASSDTLAVNLHPTIGNTSELTVMQLWSRNNYHWYLKQELQLLSEEELVDFAWDDEAAGRLNLLTCSMATQELTLYEHEFAWDICSVEGQRFLSTRPLEPLQVQSVAVTGVIDGSKLLLTPLHRAMVPPPFALLQATFDAAINSVVFDSQIEALLVLLADGSVVLVESYLTPADTRASTAGLPPSSLPTTPNDEAVSPMTMTTINLPQTFVNDEIFTLQSLLWVRLHAASHQLVFAGKSGRQDQLVLCSFDCLNATTSIETKAIVDSIDLFDIRTACEVKQVESRDDKGITDESSVSLAVQTQRGEVYTLHTLTVGSPVLTRVTGTFPAFSHLIALNSGDEDILIIGLEGSSARLYVNGELLASACSSFRYSPLASVLLFTTQGRESQVQIVPLNGLRNFCRDQSADLDTVTFESRLIERGALLVATVGQRANVIVQMSRGNLECITPRLLVLALVVQQIETYEYVAALELCRRHRLDLNVLVDFNFQAFIQNFSQFLVKRFLSTRAAPVTSDRLCLFITNLHSIDVWETKYGPLLEPFTMKKNTPEIGVDFEKAEKVNAVCEAFMDAIEELESTEEDAKMALVLPFVTSAVKQSPPRFDKALGKIKKLLHESEESEELIRNRAAATRAIKHLIMLTDVESLYSEALGLYDLELVRTVATHSQRDPKEYVPFLDQVAQLEHENWRKYTIDVHLGRHTQALTHLAALIDDLSAENEEEKARLQAMALELIQKGELYNEALKLFPLASVKTSAAPSERAFRRRILSLKGDFLGSEKKFEAAAYVYLSASDKEKARGAFLAAKKWQMALALSACDQSPDIVRSEAYSIAEELLNKQEQQQDGSVDDVLAVARIYVEYCKDIDEAVGLLVSHQQWAEALRIAYLHNREDLVESDVETGVLQSCDEVQEELQRNEKLYGKHWKRLSTIREQKRLFKLHGIDGSRWDHNNGGDNDTDAGSIRSGASSAADSALSNVSMSSVGSHNSAASIGNFSMQSLSMATASHFYATQALGDAGKKSKAKTKHGGTPSRRERRKRMKEGSAEEEAYVAQQLSELRPTAALARDVGALLEMLVFFGHLQQAQKLQTQLLGFEQSVKKMPMDGKDEDAVVYPQWQLEALDG